MAEKTKIQWCDDTANFWSGCEKVSPGCKNCYAEALSNRNLGHIGKWGKGATRVRHESAFKSVRSWNKKRWVCDQCGEAVCDRDVLSHLHFGEPSTFRRRRVFSLSLGDWLDDEVPIEYLADMLKVIHDCPDMDFLLLTKRPENFFKRMVAVSEHCEEVGKTVLFDWIENEWMDESPPKNIWLGVSVENQKAADGRIPALLKIPAKVRFLSVEPLLEAVDLTRVQFPTIHGEVAPHNALIDPISDSARKDYGIKFKVPHIDWVIVGGESGANARPCNVEWIHSIVAQCKAAGVACFVKQLGANSTFPHPCPTTSHVFGGNDNVDGVMKLKDEKGGDMNEWPEDLRVREFPSGNGRKNVFKAPCCVRTNG